MSIAIIIGVLHLCDISTLSVKVYMLFIIIVKLCLCIIYIMHLFWSTETRLSDIASKKVKQNAHTHTRNLRKEQEETK